ncbi:hypothetical protein AMECASPLE_039681 [Ameca splendens]|uniref:Uncharacterized protein n=1 Tax=Ameca splendens TaxID=208324 RepID=A0ABV1A3V3_9TELE
MLFRMSYCTERDISQVIGMFLLDLEGGEKTHFLTFIPNNSGVLWFIQFKVVTLHPPYSLYRSAQLSRTFPQLLPFRNLASTRNYNLCVQNIKEVLLCELGAKAKSYRKIITKRLLNEQGVNP